MPAALTPTMEERGVRNTGDILDAGAMAALKKHGYTPDRDVAAYWLEHRAVLTPAINRKNPTLSQKFETQVRWHTPIGKACREGILAYIEAQQEASRLKTSAEYRSGQTFALNLADLSFDDFRFEFGGSKRSLADFTHNAKTSGHLFGVHDLRGIDLRRIRIADCRIRNVSFSEAHFEGANLQQIWCENCNFGMAHFQDARLVAVRLDARSTLGGARCQNAFLNAIVFSADTLRAPLRLAEITYWQMLGCLLQAWHTSPFDSRVRHKWTDLLMVDVRSVDHPEFVPQKEYIYWYQAMRVRMTGLSSLPLGQRVGFTLSVVTTQYWSSYLALCCTAACINAVFATAYWLTSSSFTHLAPDWFAALYFSVVTFTTLGYGDISPTTHAAMTLCMIEVLLGYVVLACVIFLISRKVSLRS